MKIRWSYVLPLVVLCLSLRNPYYFPEEIAMDSP